MKKTMVILTILSILFFSFTTNVYAASNDRKVPTDAILAEMIDTKDIEVTLSDSPSAVKVGETIELIATADKYGSSYIDSWDNASMVSTLFIPETETYISKAIFTAVNPGTYTIRYSVQMTAGNSNTIFAKTVEKTIEVINPIIVIGAGIQDLTINPVYIADGSLSGYSASGMAYAIRSDNTTTPCGSIFFFFAPSENTKDVPVTLFINSQVYSYLVTVTR